MFTRLTGGNLTKMYEFNFGRYFDNLPKLEGGGECSIFHLLCR